MWICPKGLGAHQVQFETGRAWRKLGIYHYVVNSVPSQSPQFPRESRLPRRTLRTLPLPAKPPSSHVPQPLARITHRFQLTFSAVRQDWPCSRLAPCEGGLQGTVANGKHDQLLLLGHGFQATQRLQESRYLQVQTSLLVNPSAREGEVSLTLFDSLPFHGRQAALQYSFPNCESVCCSMPSSNGCFLTSLQVSQETDKVVWYTHLFKNFPVCCNPHSQRLQHSQ